MGEGERKGREAGGEEQVGEGMNATEKQGRVNRMFKVGSVLSSAVPQCAR